MRKVEIFRNLESDFRVKAVYFDGKNHNEVAKILPYHQVKKVGECIMIDYEKIEPHNYIYIGFTDGEYFVNPPKIFERKFQKDRWEQEA